MGRLIVRRLLSVPLVLLLVSFGVFMLVALVPGNPAITLAGGASASPAAVAHVRQELHLNEPLLEQYWQWLWCALHLDFGRSLISGIPVSTEIAAARLPVTLSLVIAASVVAVVIGIPLGVLSGLRPDTVVDGGARVLSSAGLAMPNFWLAVVLISLFAVQWKLFPPSGYTAVTTSFGAWLREITLPAVALGLAVGAVLARQLRASVVEVMQAPFVRTAWAKGLKPSGVITWHVLKNASLPAVTVLGVQIGYLLGGAVIIEEIFSIPGLGTYMLQGISDHDLPVVQGVVLVFVLFQMAMSLLVDISYGYLNPKVRGLVTLGYREQLVGGDAGADAEAETSGPHDRNRRPGRLPSGEDGPRHRRSRIFLGHTGAVLASAWILLLVVVALFAPLVAPHSPTAQDLLHTFAGPSLSHPLGTDDLGRDVLSRLIYGARASLRVSFEVVGIALVFAVPIGMVSGLRGGQVDDVIMRVMDAGLSFPPLVLALAIAGVLGPSINNAALAIAVVFIPSFVRLIRGQTLAVKEEPFIEASRSLGASTWALATRCVLPNVLSALIVQISVALGGALLAEAALSFLGLGVQPPTPSWGSMLQEAYNTGLFSHPWSLVVPGAAIAVTVLAFNTIGDGLSAAVHETPRVKRRLHLGRSAGRGLLTVVTEPAHPDPAGTPPAADEADRAGASMGDPLLEIEGLTVEVAVGDTPLPVVEEVSLRVGRGEIVGLVGESGSGKSVTSLAVMRLLASPPFTITDGSVRLEGRDLLTLGFDQMRQVRGGSIATVFQDPMASLNPALTVGTQLREAIRAHERTTRRDAATRAVEVLERVGVASPESTVHAYPHQLSGGIRQRVMIAMALSCHPKLLIADEPTTALDVTIQAQILELLRDLCRREGLSVILVTHDLGVVAEVCDSVAVMYAGQIVEQGPVGELFAAPAHPYTEGLIGASDLRGGPGELLAIPGQVPPLGQMPEGCRFHPRCPYAEDRCAQGPPAAEITDDRMVRCLRRDTLVLRGTR